MCGEEVEAERPCLYSVVPVRVGREIAQSQLARSGDPESIERGDGTMALYCRPRSCVLAQVQSTISVEDPKCRRNDSFDVALVAGLIHD